MTTFIQQRRKLEPTVKAKVLRRLTYGKPLIRGTFTREDFVNDKLVKCFCAVGLIGDTAGIDLKNRDTYDKLYAIIGVANTTDLINLNDQGNIYPDRERNRRVIGWVKVNL